MRSGLHRRARRSVLVLLVISLVAASVAQAATRPRVPKRSVQPPVVGQQLGIADGSLLWLSPSEQARALDDIAALGMRWVRVDFPWSSVQHGGPDAWDWTALDRFVAAASARQLRVLALLGHAPTWARPAGTPAFSAPNELDGFVRFTRAAVTRYAPRGVKAWEVWNEPNIKMFWGRAPSATDYAEMLIRTSAAIKSVDATATVVSAGLSPATDVEGESIAPLPFLYAMYSAGVGPAIDAVGMHPYSFPYPADTPESWNTFHMLPWVQLIMQMFGDGAKPIWATEIGWTTAKSDLGVTEDVQARRLADAIRSWRAFSFNGPIFVYNYRDSADDPHDWSHNLGLYRSDGTPKPAVSVLSSFLRTRLPR